MFQIYKECSKINPKVGDVIQYNKIYVEIVEILHRGFFVVDKPECFSLRVKKSNAGV